MDLLWDYLFGVFSCTRLLQHAVALRQLSHRNIVAVYDAFSAVNSSTDSNADSDERTSSVSVYVVQVGCRLNLSYLVCMHSLEVTSLYTCCFGKLLNGKN